MRVHPQVKGLTKYTPNYTRSIIRGIVLYLQSCC